MKKIFSIIGGILGVFVLGILIFCIYFAVSVKDNTNRTPEDIVTNHYDAMEVFSREMTEALSYSDEMKLDIDAHDLNEILYGALTNVKISGIEMKGAYVEYKDDLYCVEIPAKAMGVDTCVKCKISISITQENGIQIQIHDFKMGKFDTDSFIVRKFVLNKNTRDSIVNSLSKKGIEITMGKNLDISMNKDQLITTLSNVVTDKKDASLFVLIARLALESDLLEFNTKNSIGFTMNLTDLFYDASRDGTISTFVPFDKAISKTKDRLAESCTYKEVGAVFNYYVGGYDSLNEKKKAMIDSLGYSTSEEGIKDEGSTMLKLILSHSPSVIESIANKGFTIALNDNEVNSAFQAMPFIGAGTCFTDGVNTGFIAVDALTFTMKDQAIEIHFILNLNGKQISIFASTDALDSESLSLTAHVKELSIGNKKMEDKYIIYVLEYLNGILEEQNWIYTDSKENLFLDFEEVIKESNILGLFSNSIIKRNVHIRQNSLEIIFKL